MKPHETIEMSPESQMYKRVQYVSVPALGFGTWRYSGEDCYQGVLDALAVGYRHIDTAALYENEREVGRAIAASGLRRDAIFLVTKIWMDHLAHDTLLDEAQRSLDRLDVEWVDLLMPHWPNDAIPVAQTMRALATLREQGRVRHIGLSNYTTALARQAAEHAPIFCNQVEYHPYLSQAAVLEQAVQRDWLVAAYRPLGRGVVLDEPVVQRIAQRHGKTPAQVVLRWGVQQPRVITLPKAASPEHRRENFAIWDFELTADDMAAIHALARGQRLVNPEHAPTWDG